MLNEYRGSDLWTLAVEMFFHSIAYLFTAILRLTVVESQDLPSPPPPSKPAKQAKTPATPLFGQAFGTDLVDITVGAHQNKQTFHVHKTFLCAEVPYFAYLLRDASSASAPDRVDLPDDDPTAFALFLEWLYRRKYAPLDIHDRNAFTDRIKLYCFADKIDVLELMDYTMTVLISNYQKHGKVPGAAAARIAYQCSGPGSHIRGFVALCLAATLVGTEEDVLATPTSEKFLALMTEVYELGLDMIRLMRKQDCCPMPLAKLLALPKCHFHVHVDGEECEFMEEIL